MKLNINGYFLKFLNVGLGKYSFELIKHLNKNEKEIHLFIPKDKTYDDNSLSIIKNIHVHKQGSIRKIKNEYYGARLWEYSLYKKLSNEKNSIMFSPYFSCSPNLFKYEVITVGDIIQYLFPKQYAPSISSKIINYYYKHYLKYVKNIITFSEHSKWDIVKYFNYNAENIFSIPLGVTENYKPVGYNKECLSIKNKYLLPDKYILYIGGYDYRKNVIELLKAFKKLRSFASHKDIYLVLVGEIPHKRKKIIPDIRRAIKEIGEDKYIINIGNVPEFILPYFYSLASLFVYPSFYEGFGLPVLEAIACGTPTIASKASSIPEIINRDDILYKTGDYNILAQKMNNILKDNSYREELSNWGIARSKNFTWQKTAQLTEKVFDSIIC